MVSIIVLKSGLDVSKIREQLIEYKDDWNHSRDGKNVQSLLDDRYGFPAVDAGVLQLIMGLIEKEGDFVGDSELSMPTDAYNHHTAVRELLAEHGFDQLERCGFLSLPVGGEVGTHIDEGTYYHTRDRFHLAVNGTYTYHVGDDEVLVEPGTLLWFNNKQPHGTHNVGDETRVTFVFDVLHKNRVYALPPV
jgi:mannose-6-phosphate isomerase-like protein (cupin superfamily)